MNICPIFCSSDIFFSDSARPLLAFLVEMDRAGLLKFLFGNAGHGNQQTKYEGKRANHSQ